MMMAAPPLPTRFPCWCKAVYSWGGETKRDLGFIEGDLIECLNAGDGSWWMGRLRRDRRMVGLFPSNFVQLLPDDFQPGSRNASPMTNGGGSVNKGSPQAAQQTPQKNKSVFRKPFQAYAAAGSPNPAAAAREVSKTNGVASQSNGSISKLRPYSSMKRTSDGTNSGPPSRDGTLNSGRPTNLRAISPAPRSAGLSKPRATSPMPLRATSPAPYRAMSPAPPPLSHQGSHSRSRAPSPAMYDRYQQPVRANSPAPYHEQIRAISPAPYHQPSRGPTPNPYDDQGSPPPPAPPPHRVLHQSRAPSPAPYHNEHYQNGYHTPEPRGSGEHTGMTPSPLTNAMNDVMTSLQDMSLGGRNSPCPPPPPNQTPPSVWSPEAFDQIYASSARKIRAQSSLGQTMQQAQEDVDDEEAYAGAPPQLSNYVQRMESRLRRMHEQEESLNQGAELYLPDREDSQPPPVPLKTSGFWSRPGSARRPNSSRDADVPAEVEEIPRSASRFGSRRIKNRKSAYELGRDALARTFTTKTSATSSTTHSGSSNQSRSTQISSHSLMSASSAGAVSATSAGSLARKKWGLSSRGSVKGNDMRPASSMNVSERSQTSLGHHASTFSVGKESRPETPFTGITFHSSHASVPNNSQGQTDWTGNVAESGGLLGGLMPALQKKKSGFFKKMLETAKTGAANARSTIATSQSGSRTPSPQKNSVLARITAIEGGVGFSSPASAHANSPAKDMGLGGGHEWVSVRRDVNRSNSLSKNERLERIERCEMLDIAVITPIEALYDATEGDEGLDGLPIAEPTDFTNSANLALVDKNSRFIANLPPLANAASLAQGYVCRPYRSDVQRLRAIFTWVSERIAWEEDYEGDIDTRRVIQTKRGCSQEIAMLVMEMCAAVGLHAEVVRGFLKVPGELPDLEAVARPNHWWNAVIVDGEWRIMDCSLASPTNPKRGLYSSAGPHNAESWWFLARPMEVCYTHVPLLPEQQHITPHVAHEILMALPCACPPYFKNGLQVSDFDTSILNLENLEMAHLHIFVPEDVECLAEVEARAFAQDADGDFFESGDVIRKKALAQAEWIGGRKRYTVKALLPGDEGQGVLKIYAGKRGLMHSIRDNPHSLAFALPLLHTGQNPPYDFVTRHPTPHAQRHDLYIAQPQCARLAVNNTFVFSIRQHPSTLSTAYTPDCVNQNRAPSPSPFNRPTSAMSMTSVSISGSQYSNPSSASFGSQSGSGSSGGGQKPAKLAIQSPSGKIIRLVRKNDAMTGEEGDGSSWETVIKIGESGTWRGLVLADRSARWCVFAEWFCA